MDWFVHGFRRTIVRRTSAIAFMLAGHRPSGRADRAPSAMSVVEIPFRRSES